MIDDYVERFDISVHDSVRMRILKGLQYHVGVQPDVHVIEFASQNLSLNIGDVFEDECWGFRRRVTQNVKQFDDIGAAI